MSLTLNGISPAASYVVLPSRDWRNPGGFCEHGQDTLATFFTVPMDLSQVPTFERSALEIAAGIPYWEVRSFKWIAERLGRPDAARAVGNAMAGNLVPIIVPCHGVVKTDGGLGGYSFGLLRKEAPT